ncbi:MAG: tetratricopeptide repeat protein, partial [Saprospiraceae bacterium]
GFDGDVQRESQFQYAKLSYELGYDREALIELQNVKSGSPHFTEAQNLMSQLLLKSGDYDKALELMESLTNTTPKIQEAYQQVSYLKGIQLYKDGQYGASEEFLLRSQTYQLIPKTYALSFYYLGEIGYKLNEFQKSQNNFEQFNVRAKSVNNLPEEANTYTANYNIGYLQLKQKSYALAAEYFTLSINEINQNKPFINSSDIKNRLYPDAILRAADCYFKDNRYDNAIRYYNRSIKNELPGQDYALFQKGRILGIQGKKQEEINTFNTLANKFPNSSYTDDGLYLLARAYYNNGERNSALASAQTLIDNHPNSQLKNQTHLLLGLMYYNENEDQAALEEYVKVIRNNPTQQESNSARTAVTEIYMDNNNPEGLIEFNKNILGYDMTNYAKDSLLYRSAEILYEQGDFVNAKNAYAKHIQQFPESPLSIYSHYNKGECHLVSKEYRNALAEYDYVIQQGQSNLYENALTKAANLSYNKFKNFSKAYTY